MCIRVFCWFKNQNAGTMPTEAATFDMLRMSVCSVGAFSTSHCNLSVVSTDYNEL